MPVESPNLQITQAVDTLTAPRVEFSTQMPVASYPEIQKLQLYPFKNQLATSLQNDTILAVVPTGWGKTVGIPPMAREIKGDINIAATVPTRSVTTSVAEYEGKITDGKGVGHLVGLFHKYSHKAGEETRIAYYVEASLLNRLRTDPLLLGNPQAENPYEKRRLDMVMIDEAHKRKETTDQLIELLHDVQLQRKAQSLPDLQLVMSTATADALPLQNYTGAEIFEVKDPVSKYEVEPIWGTEDVKDYAYLPQIAAKQVIWALKHPSEKFKQGNILVFLPGMAEITEMMDILATQLPQEGIDPSRLDLLGFDASTIDAVRDKIMADEPDKIKVFGTTNVIDTGITIPATDVIVSGISNQTFVDPLRGLTGIKKEDISQSEAIQERGRVGRTGNGRVHYLFTEKYNEKERPQYQTPEILTKDITSTVLNLLYLGKDPYTFNYLDKPQTIMIDNAMMTLKLLGAVDLDNKITSMGEEIIDVAADPHIARMLIEARKENCGQAVAAISAVMENYHKLFKGVNKNTEAEFRKAMEPFVDDTSDPLTMLKIWQVYSEPAKTPQPLDKFVNTVVLEKIRKRFNELSREAGGDSVDPKAIVRSFLAGFRDRLLARPKLGTNEVVSEIFPQYGLIDVGRRSALYNARPSFVVAGRIGLIGKYEQAMAEQNQLVEDENFAEDTLKLAEQIRKIDSGKRPSDKPITRESAQKMAQTYQVAPQASEEINQKVVENLQTSPPKTSEEAIQTTYNTVQRFFTNLSPARLWQKVKDFFFSK